MVVRDIFLTYSGIISSAPVVIILEPFLKCTEVLYLADVNVLQDQIKNSF